jgi:hypothetical protein
MQSLWPFDCHITAMAENISGMRCYLHTDRRTELTCVGCGGAICGECTTPRARGPFCPQCLADWNSPPVRDAAAGVVEVRGNRLSTAAKLLAAYTLIVSIWALATAAWYQNLGWVPAHFLPVIGLTAGIMMWKRVPAGWFLGVLWSTCQIVTINLGSGWLNKQMFYLGANITVNQLGFGINLVGVLLLVAFIRLRSEFLEGRAA